MIKLRIDRKKVDRVAVYKAQSGAEYYDFTLLTNRDGPDRYGYDGFIVQDIGKERREAGEKGPIIGNWRRAGGTGVARATAPDPQHLGPVGDDEIPF